MKDDKDRRGASTRGTSPRELLEKWDALRDDDDFRDEQGQPLWRLVAAVDEDDGKPVWDETLPSGTSARDALEAREVGLYAIQALEEGGAWKTSTRCRIDEAGSRVAVTRQRGADPVGVVSRETAKVTDAWERLYNNAQATIAKQDRKIEDLRAKLQVADEKVLDLMAQVADKENWQDSIPDLAKEAIEAFTGKKMRAVCMAVANDVLAMVPDVEARAQLMLAVIASVDRHLSNMKAPQLEGKDE